MQVLHLRGESLLFSVRRDAIQTDEAGGAFHAAPLLMINDYSLNDYNHSISDSPPSQGIPG